MKQVTRECNTSTWIPQRCGPSVLSHRVPSGSCRAHSSSCICTPQEGKATAGKTPLNTIKLHQSRAHKREFEFSGPSGQGRSSCSSPAHSLQQLRPPLQHGNQAAARVVVLMVLFQMLSHGCNLVRQRRNCTSNHGLGPVRLHTLSCPEHSAARAPRHLERRV